MTATKLFTPEEAEKTLPLIRKIVEDILRAGQSIREISVDMEKPEDDPEVIRLMDKLDELFEEMESLGCYYKDWNFTQGLVDFPARINGRDVLLCWRSDEEKVAYFHDAESGYAGRRPIPR